MMARVYLDWNATAPLRPEARAAMLAAMDAVGNPSSVHAEGRAARAIVERARAQVAAAFGAADADIVFTSGATEAAALAMAGRGLKVADIEHDAVHSHGVAALPTAAGGVVAVDDPGTSALQLANPETGLLQDLPEGLALTDAVQAAGKIPFAFSWSGADMALISAHKFGGPKGVGALILRRGLDVTAMLTGGGQEMGRRSGTENLAGIAGMGAAAEAAARDLDAGVWDAVAARRDRLEAGVAAIAQDAVIVGQGARRLPNTTLIVTPGWKGETQVMQMDLGGYAASAGSACSSGKVKSSRVLRAMGFDADAAQSGLRVSIGPTTTDEDIDGFLRTWGAAFERHRARAA